MGVMLEAEYAEWRQAPLRRQELCGSYLWVYLKSVKAFDGAAANHPPEWRGGTLFRERASWKSRMSSHRPARAASVPRRLSKKGD